VGQCLIQDLDGRSRYEWKLEIDHGDKMCHFIKGFIILGNNIGRITFVEENVNQPKKSRSDSIMVQASHTVLKVRSLL